MYKQLNSLIKRLSKSLLVVGLAALLFVSQADGALAARSGGRIGGGSFRAPSRTYSQPSRGYYPPSGGGYYPGGGGFGFPFLIPVFGIGGGFGGLFSILIFFAIAGFLVNTFRRVTSGGEIGGDYEISSPNPTVSIAKVQVGLMAGARSLQQDLDRIAQTANTQSTEGLTQALQETTLALLRHPEYWAYASGEAQQTRLNAAEAQFNRLALAERSKFGEETLSNVNNQRRIRGAQETGLVRSPGGALAETDGTAGEYIVATILVGTEGKLQLPPINNTTDLRQALSQLGAVSSDRLLAVEILWAPQAEGDTLTADDLIAEYPNLKLI